MKETGGKNMKNRIAKITLTLIMLLVMAVPTQAFAAEINCNNTLELFKYNYNNLTWESGQQVTNKIQVTKAAPAVPAKQAAPVAKATPAAPAKSAATPAAPAAPSTANIGAYEQQVVDLVNKERAAVGLPALKVNTKLAGVAEKKAEDLRDKNYFAHQSPTYGSPFDMMKQFGISYSTAGENIAKGQKTPSAVMNGWMNSQGHKDNILNSSFTEIGVGYVTDSNGNTYWVQMFIRP